MVAGEPDVDRPVLLEIDPGGSMRGASRRYEKTLGDMGGVYLDDDAWRAEVTRCGGQALVYAVEDQRYRDAEGALIVGTSTVLPGRYGREFAVTRGHLHARADRAELYHCLSGRGVLLLETVDGESEAVELVAGAAVNVPGHWIHRSVNVGDRPFVTLFCYSSDAGQDYGLIERAGGMRRLIVADDGARGWRSVPNPRHVGYARSAA